MVDFDVVVVGAGGVGSAALWHLARRKKRVLGIDRFAPPHDRGSTHGKTRIIRQAYFEHPNYTPLLVESYRLWNELESQVGQQLYHEIGVLQVGPPDGVVVPGVLKAAEEHAIAVESLTAKEIEKRWSGFRVTDDLVGVLEPRAGFLLVDDCVQAHLDAAQDAGAQFQFDVEVKSWELGSPIRITTSAGEITTEKLVVTAGPWAGDLLADLGLPLEVLRKCLFWFVPDGDQYRVESGLPNFLFELPSGMFYGFPQVDSLGVKVAEHSGGQVLSDPLEVDRQQNEDDIRQIGAFVGQHLPGISSGPTHHATCMYTVTPDEHFIVDRDPHHPNVVFVAGLSGHGFKFAPVLGKALADLTLDDGTELPIDFLSHRRFKT